MQLVHSNVVIIYVKHELFLFYSFLRVMLLVLVSFRLMAKHLSPCFRVKISC